MGASFLLFPFCVPAIPIGFLVDLRKNIHVSMYISLDGSVECVPAYEYLDIHESSHLSLEMLKVSFPPKYLAHLMILCKVLRSLRKTWIKYF
jgi:hypothetical protein